MPLSDLPKLIDSRFATVSEDLAKRRLEACNSCDKLVLGFCSKCKCFMQFKVKFKRMDCSLGKWPNE